VIVVDTSAVIAALAGKLADSFLVDRLRGDGDLHAPHLLDIEVLHALRGLVSAKALSPGRAEEVRIDFADLAVVRYPHHPLADRIWELRNNLTAYDAAFVALAEALEVSLITCDGRLRRASGHSATVELYGRK
jgi:predicted nucleic acid-binding protein